MRQRVNRWLCLSGFLLLLFVTASNAQTLTGVSISLDDSTAGARSVHTITFTHAGAIPADGKIVFVYPVEFDLTDANVVYSDDIDEFWTVSTSSDSVVIERDGNGDPELPGRSETLQVAVVTNATVVGTYQVTVKTKNTNDLLLEWGLSNTFEIVAGDVDSFAFSLPVGVLNQGIDAGTPFQVDIEALDAFGNRATGFTGTATLSDQTGTILVTSTGTDQTSNFAAGIWSGNVTVRQTTGSNTIYAFSSGNTGNSAAFTVNPGAINRFQFFAISSPQTAGTAFALTITAFDQYDNVKTDYTNSVALTEKTGTLQVPATGTSNTPGFISGAWTGTVQIFDAEQDIYIQASGDGRTGTSGPFNVIASGVDHFTLENISTQSAGEAFLIKVTARDQYDNIAETFDGGGAAVTIGHTGSGTVSPTQSGSFASGFWAGNVRISQTQTNDQISVDDGSGHTGLSNQFDIISSSVDHFVLSNIGGQQTAGLGFSVTITAEDANNNTVTGFTQQVNVLDETGSNSPQQVILTNGVWTGSIQISKASTGNHLTVTALGKSSVSNDFDVQGAPVDRFEFSDISSPQVAGSGFSTTITALDQYGNTAQSFTGSVNISAGAVSVSPAVSGNFSNGIRTQTLTINEASSDLQITVNDGSGHQGASNFFNLSHGALNHFELGQIPDQATGVPFSITVSALDAFGNTVTSFEGTGDRVLITHQGIGAISRNESGDFENGLWSGTVAVSQTQSSDRIVVTRSGGGETGMSNPFDVTPATVDYFAIDNVPVNQVAGQSITTTVRAFDSNDNLVTSFNGVVNLTDETRTNDVKQVTFTTGIGTVDVTITQSSENNTFTVTAQGKSGISNAFNVAAAAVDTFILATVASPQVAGNAFPVIIRALDAYGNLANHFGGSVSLTDITGSIQQNTSGNFLEGVRTETVTITEAGNDNQIFVDDGSGNTGQSNFFNVIPAALAQFAVETIYDQIVGVPFAVTLTAQDAYGNVNTNYIQTVDVTDQSGTVSPTVSSNFVNGIVSMPITIHQEFSNDFLTFTETGGLVFSNSNGFDVVANPGIRITRFEAVDQGTEQPIQSVTSDQDTLWHLRCQVENLSGAQANLDSVRIQITVNGQIRNDYTLDIPVTFWGNGSALLPGSQTDSLLIPIRKTGSTAGPASIRLFLYLKNMDSGATLRDDAITNLMVQTPARLIIREVRPSQPEISKGQTRDWRTTVVVSNTGGSAVQIDSSISRTFLLFSIGQEFTWDVMHPPVWSGDWILEGGETDSLVYSVLQTTSSGTGDCRLDAYVSGVELNTGLALTTNTISGNFGSVRIENPAELRIIQTLNQAPNRPNVNREQTFNLAVQVQNVGGDILNDVNLQVTSNGSSIYNASHPIGRLAGQEMRTVQIPVTAANSLTASEIFTAGVSGTTENTNAYLEDTNSIDDTARVRIQNPASLEILSITPTEKQLLGGQTDLWLVKVAVRNTGGAILDLVKPVSDSLSFWVDGLFQSDYKVLPPGGLLSGGLALESAAIDTLVYGITTTGTYGGTVVVRAVVGGRDRNSQTPQKVVAQTTVSVVAEKAFRIISTQIDAFHTTDAKNGFVNIGQEFRVLVILENGLGGTIRNIGLKLKTNGSSRIGDPDVQIGILDPSKKDSTYFVITAANQENLNGETFTAQIVGAKRENGTDDAPVGSALDSTASVQLQSPARLSLNLSVEPDDVVSVGQEFTLLVELIKQGSSGLLNDGRVSVQYPEAYSLISAVDTASVTPTQTAQFRFNAPDDSSSNDRFLVILDRYPDDANTGEKAQVPNNSAYIDMRTITSLLVSETNIITPAGASDGILSTGQSFVVRTKVQSKNVTEILARIFLPSGYHTKTNLIQNTVGDSATWEVSAPSSASQDDVLLVSVSGKDALQPNVQVTGEKDTLRLQTVSRADLELTMTIDSPPEAAQYGTVSLGQEFVIRVSVANRGDALTQGEIQVALDPLPSGYTTQNSLSQTIVNENAFWTLKAPTEPDIAAVQIRSKIIATPDDENTDQPAHISRPNQAVAVTLEGAWLAISKLTLADGTQQSLTPGQTNVHFFGLLLDNRGESGTYTIEVQELRLYIADRNGEGVLPHAALSQLQIVDLDGETVYGELSSMPSANPITIPITDLIIPYNKNANVRVQGKIALTETVPYFTVSLLNGDAVTAKEVASDRLVLVLNPSNEPLSPIQSDIKKIFNPESEYQLWNSPNPFGEPGRERTKIYYFVPEVTDVTFRIYTLVGRLVKTKSFDQNEVIAGQVNFWIWDGRNDKNLVVLNGIYHLIMQTGQGQVFKTKIAFVK